MGQSICVLDNPQHVTHTLLVCPFTVGLAHSIPNPKPQRGRERETEAEKNLCTYMWNVSIINNSSSSSPFIILTHTHSQLHFNILRRRLFPDAALVPPVAPTTDVTV